MVGFLDGPLWLRVLIGTGGVCISAVASVLSFMKFYEKWLTYRSTCEALKRELFLFQTRAGAYKKRNKPFAVLVEHTEDIISHENINWLILCTDEEEEKTPTVN